MPTMEREGVVSMEMTSGRQVGPVKRQSKRLNQWELIRAARAFYGRPLGPDDLSKIHAAQEMASKPRPKLRAVPSMRSGAARPDHTQRVHGAGEGNVQQASVEGAA